MKCDRNNDRCACRATGDNGQLGPPLRTDVADEDGCDEPEKRNDEDCKYAPYGVG